MNTTISSKFSNSRRYLRTLSVILLALVLMPAISAQTPGKRPDADKVLHYKAVKMARQLKLDADTETAFVPLYEGFQREMSQIMRGSHPIRKEDVTTDEQAETNILADFATSRKILDLRERYYAEFRKILPPLQIRRMYAIEKENAEKR